MSSDDKVSPKSMYGVCMRYAKEESAADSAGDYRKGMYDGVMLALHELGHITNEQQTAYEEAKKAAKLNAGAGNADA